MNTTVLTLPPRARSALRNAVILLLTVGVLVAMVAIAVLANASLLAMTACAQTAPERYVLRGDHIDICDLAGTVRVVPGTGPDIVVLVTRGGRDAARLRVETGNSRGRTTLHVIYPGDRVIYGRMRHGRTTLTVGHDGCLASGDHSLFGRRRVTITGYGRGLEAWADLEIRLPRGLTSAVRLGVGEMTATGIDGDLTLDVAAASVRAERTRGPLVVDTGSGDVVMSDNEGSDILVDTGSGSVEIDGLRGGRVKVDTGSGEVTASRVAVEDLLVDTGSGGVELNDVTAPTISVDTGSGGVHVGLSRGPRSLIVDTGSGGVTILGPPDLGAEVEVETGSGSIHTDYALVLTHKEHGYLQGTIGDGRGHIKVDTGSGGVSIRRR